MLRNVHISFIVSVTLIVGIISCDSDDNEVQEPKAEPTVFQGRVLYSDTNEPVSNASFFIAGRESVLFAGDITIEFNDVMLDAASQGEFDISFNADPEIDYFFIGVDFFDEENPGLIIGGSDFANGMVCSPVGCDDFVPGNEYTDLTIVVPRPEPN